LDELNNLRRRNISLQKMQVQDSSFYKVNDRENTHEMKSERVSLQNEKNSLLDISDKGAGCECKCQIY
jgi:hypothetical protein